MPRLNRPRGILGATRLRGRHHSSFRRDVGQRAGWWRAARWTQAALRANVLAHLPRQTAQPLSRRSLTKLSHACWMGVTVGVKRYVSGQFRIGTAVGETGFEPATP